MPVTVITARAPSNIALVKYMGKKDSKLNLPANTSVSMTLNSLSTLAQVSITSGVSGGGGRLTWVPEFPGLESVWKVPDLNDSGLRKIQNHWERIQREVPPLLAQRGLDTRDIMSCLFELRTANNFPPASGIASSASSFAAITLALSAALAKDTDRFCDIYQGTPELRQALAGISRCGSGSSCRSFDGPWVAWTEDQVRVVPASKKVHLAHFVILFKTDPKTVSSSEAHAKVLTSPLWEGRAQRAEDRAVELCKALESGDLSTTAKLAWNEAWEMHSLFHTAQQPFSYWVPETLAALQWLQPMVQSGVEDSAAPIVTLDAGPNVHVLVPYEKQKEWAIRLRSRFPGHVILEDESGTGAIVKRD